MFKSSTGKFFFGFLLSFAASCSIWRAEEQAAPSPTPFVAAEIKSEIPFSTKEPEIYQAEIISQIYHADGEKTERKVFMARNGAKRLTVFNINEADETSLLELETNQIILVNGSKKIYAEMLPNSSADAVVENSENFTKPEWLNQKTAARFENLGAENGLARFRVQLGDAETTNSEILISVDENLKFPVKQEFYSVTGDQKILTFSTEVKNFKFETDAKFFEVPKDYRKVAAKEFQEALRRIEGK